MLLFCESAYFFASHDGGGTMTSKGLFTDIDLKRISEEGLTEEDVRSQLTIFTRGVPPITLNRPCTIGDGIAAVADEEQEPLIKAHETAAAQGQMSAFVPASGAATRMFSEWFHYEETTGFDESEAGEKFAEDLSRFAFYDDLKEIIAEKGGNLATLLQARRYTTVLQYILSPEGLNYAHLPKALLKFHTYPEGSRTSLEEHLIEAARYITDSDRMCRFHITVSEEHKPAIETSLHHIRERCERDYNVRFHISLSVQQSSTNTIAVDMDNRPFRDDTGTLVFRPGGHGALLKNLNSIKNDIIFLKNIDNIAPDRLKPQCILHKKILGGYAVSLQRKIHSYLQRLSEGPVDDTLLSEILHFSKEKLFTLFPPEFDNLSCEGKTPIVFDILNRPLRICGMVKNEGEPGGGPYWMKDNRTPSPQIIEQAQIDLTSEEQQQVMRSSTHFNPVDVVCAVRDFRGDIFDLEHYVNRNAYFISQKSFEGKHLKALEHPGLWNGAMAHWITVFVEVPITTFNPVKTVYDLLRKEHVPEP